MESYEANSLIADTLMIANVTATSLQVVSSQSVRLTLSDLKAE
jgi:hypothetical protein